MNPITDALKSANNGDTIGALAEMAGLNKKDALKAVSAVVPELSQTLERLTLSRGGLADLVAALGDGSHARYLDDPESVSSDDARTDGEKILGHILGSKNRSRVVAARASRQSGVSQDTIKSMLPAIAALFMGELSRATGDKLAAVSVPEFDGRRGPGKNDSDAFEGHEPLPVPSDSFGRGTRSGGTNPFEDLSDVIRKGGRSRTGTNGAPGGGILWSIVRNILGAVLGFRSSGLMSWIIRVVVFQWGWQILKRILSRVVLGR